MTFLNFTDATGVTTDGVNLELVMSWSSGKMEDGTPYVLLHFAVMGSDLTRGQSDKPWAMRLTGGEREQFLAHITRRERED